MSSLFLTENQLAAEAEDRVNRTYGPKPAEEKLQLMIEYIREKHYHIVSYAIQDACRIRVGLSR